jgi:hypothetical protein
MPARNRVTPTGDIEAMPLRGAWTGNRGILHSGHEIVRFHAGNLWITCVLEFRGRWHEQWQPHHYTFLYFHDEAVSFAAGHRPCAECRRESYNAYRAAWAEGLGVDAPSATLMNQQLHGERIVRGTHHRRRYQMPWADLPEGAFVLLGTSPALVIGDRLTEWTLRGYRGRRARPIRELQTSSPHHRPLPRYAPATRFRSTHRRVENPGELNDRRGGTHKNSLTSTRYR